MAQIIIKKTGIEKKDAMGGAMVPCRSVYVYPRGKRFGSEVAVFQQHRWSDDARWKAPTLNWGSAVGGYVTIKQAEAFREVLDVAIAQAKELSGKPNVEMGDCPQCGNTDADTEVDEKFDDDGHTIYHRCPKCGCAYERYLECQFVFDNVKISKKGRKRGTKQDGSDTAKSA